MRYSLLILFMVSLGLASCKKGENDPIISLLSRKQRLSGDWDVSFAEYTHNDTTWTYNGSQLKRMENDVEIESLEVTHTFSFTKSGDYSTTKTTSYPAGYFEPNSPPIKRIYFEAGIWNFTGGAGDTKTKSQLLMQATRIERRVEGLAEVDAEVYENPIFGKVMNLDMLKNKEMRWKYDFRSSTSSTTDTETGTWEFKKK